MSTTPKLDAFINDCHSSYITPAMIEIREHLQRIPAQASDYDGPSKEAEEFMLAQGRKDMGYPSEAETRLIELVEHCIKGIYDVKRSQAACLQLAAIKRDLGLA